MCRIESSSDCGDPWTEVVADTGSTGTNYLDRGLMPEETRHYRVYAINAAGTGTTPSEVASATTLADGRGALLTPSPLVVDEGTAGSYTVELTDAPTGTVTIDGASGNTGRKDEIDEIVKAASRVMVETMNDGPA